MIRPSPFVAMEDRKAEKGGNVGGGMWDVRSKTWDVRVDS